MYKHGPNCLEGPVTRRRPWWPRKPAKRAAAPPRPTDPGIRTELVERVRREIAAGTYDTPEKWEAALDRLLDDIERDS